MDVNAEMNPSILITICQKGFMQNRTFLEDSTRCTVKENISDNSIFTNTKVEVFIAVVMRMLVG